MARIGIVTQLHPSANPRVVKEANTLAAAGHEVFIITILQMPGRELLDASVLDHRVQLVAAVNLVPGTASRVTRFMARSRKYLATGLIQRTGIELPSAVCHSPERLLKVAARLKCDLYIGHIEAGLWVGRELIRRGYQVAFDIEDWHSEDGLGSARKCFPLKLIASLESFALHHGTFVTTTSGAMAAGLAEHYGADVPAVLRNVFPKSEWDNIDRKCLDRIDDGRPSLTWFSQTIGPGRGLEEFWAALSGVKFPVQVHLRGNSRPTAINHLKESFPSTHGHTLHIHPPVPHQELLSRIAEHDIGLAIERRDPPSRNLTLTNKIFQYLQAGLAVVATATAGQRELAAQVPEAIELADNHPESLAAAINRLLCCSEHLCCSRVAARRLADSTLNWDFESRRFLDLVDRAIHPSC